MVVGKITRVAERRNSAARFPRHGPPLAMKEVLLIGHVVTRRTC